jgi:hypothetical protein
MTELQKELRRRCEEGITGHVFKSTMGELGESLKCMCGHPILGIRCIRCGLYELSAHQYRHDREN